MPSDSTPRSLAFLSFMPPGMTAPGPRHRDGLALGDVGRAADDLRGVALPHRDHADGQPVGVGMRLGRQHAADHEVLERGDAVA